MDLLLRFQEKNYDRCQLHIRAKMDQLALGLAMQYVVVVLEELWCLEQRMSRGCASPGPRRAWAKTSPAGTCSWSTPVAFLLDEQMFGRGIWVRELGETEIDRRSQQMI